MNLKSALILISLVTSPSAFAAEERFARNYSEVQNFMHQVVQRYPQNARMFTLGQSDDGRMIEGVQIGDLSRIRASRGRGIMNSLVVATHHGNEYGSTEVGLGFLASAAQAPIQGQSVFVIPVLNLSGFDRGQRREAARGTSFDPNRDYPGPCGTEGPYKLKSTAALAGFVNAMNITASATLHTFSSMVVYPWGISAQGSDLNTPYDDIFKMLTQAAVVESGYQTGNNTELLYPADGTFEDYAYWQHGIWSLLFELGVTHNPSEAQVNTMVRTNVPGIRRFLEQSPRQRAEKHAFTGHCTTTSQKIKAERLE